MRTLSLAACVAAFFICAVAAQPMTCPPRAQHRVIADCLQRVFGETPVWRGLDHGGRLYELYARRDGETWTLTVTTANGVSHIVRAGEAGYVVHQAPGEPL